MVSNRVHYTRRLSYNTNRNKIRKLRMPGGRLGLQYVHKRHRAPQLNTPSKAQATGLTSVPSKLARQNRISRPYGAVFSPKDLKTRILRAFLLEESKRAKQIIKEKKSAEPKKAKVQSKDAKPKQAAAKKPAQKK